MMEEFKNLLLKKQKEQQKKPVDKNKLKAKANVMKELSSLLSKDMAEDIKGVKKVTVASNSKEGLEEGLEKAKNIIEKKPEMEESEESEKHEELESPSEEKSEHELDAEPSENIEEEIKKLEEKLAALKAKKAE